MFLVMRMDRRSKYTISKERYEKELDLLLIVQGENQHYVLIKDFDRLYVYVYQT